MKKITIRDKNFVLSIPHSKILEAVDRVAEKINTDLAGTEPIFLAVLNGAFMFASDLMKKVHIPSEISFVKLASYEGTSSTGDVKTLIGLNRNIEGSTVVIIEDIVDTGTTIANLVAQLTPLKPKSIKIATLLLKPDVYDKDIPINYVAIEIPNDFIVGYGLDYDEHGRNLQDIYVVDEE